MTRRNKPLVAFLIVASMLFGVGMVASANMTLTVWDWHAPRVEILRQAAEEYQKIRPDIDFEFLITPYSEYWTRLLTGAAARRVPDLAYFHNAQHSRFVNVLEPYPEDMFPLDEMREKYFAFDAGFVHDGRMYYHPTGLMSALIFYNKDIFAEAGIDPADIPDTWDEFRELAKQLTKYNAQGEIEQAGFAINGYANLLMNDMMYQLGSPTYNEDGTGVNFDNEHGLLAAQTIADMYFEDRSNSPEFLDWMEAFGTERAAMTYGWTWFRGWLNSNYPDLNYGVVPLPSFTGSREPVISRNNFEAGFAVFQAVPEARKQEAFNFIQWFISEANDAVQVENNITLSTVPGDMRLWEHPDIADDPVISVLATQVAYTIFPGEFPDRVVDALVRLEEMIRNRMDPAEALRQAQEDGDRALRERPVEWIVEDQFLF